MPLRSSRTGAREGMLPACALCTPSNCTGLHHRILKNIKNYSANPQLKNSALLRQAALISASWDPSPRSLLKTPDDLQRLGELCENTLCSKGHRVSQAFSIPATHTLLQISAQKNIYIKQKKTRQSRHESTDQQCVAKKFVPWHSRDVLNEVIRAAQA